ncbi:MAG: hypothetical protein M1833_000971 [Piccolia ochrophora]|nr:MAG: hypothetical protein M1833_000971 [Piccolia ochrophora]
MAGFGDMSFQRKALSTVIEPESEDDSFNVPAHPVPGMQGAFEESMVETEREQGGSSRKPMVGKADPATRRRVLLEQRDHEETHAAQWKQKPGERYHPLWKLVAQIAFGLHLLQQGLAKSDHDVIKILQTHVNEIDEFLETTTEDFDLAMSDIDERIRCLKLPLEHDEIFDVMLEDRKFRMQIVDGNEKIEHIVSRTASAMNDALRDVHHGLEATKELGRYLMNLEREWLDKNEDQEDVYNAMTGNAEGWLQCFMSLITKAKRLKRTMMKLGGVVEELQRRAGIASRKNVAAFVNHGADVDTAPPPQQSSTSVPVSASPTRRLQEKSDNEHVLHQLESYGVPVHDSPIQNSTAAQHQFDHAESIPSLPSSEQHDHADWRPSRRSSDQATSWTEDVVDASDSPAASPVRETDVYPGISSAVPIESSGKRKGSLSLRHMFSSSFRNQPPSPLTTAVDSAYSSPDLGSSTASRRGPDSAYSSGASDLQKPPSRGSPTDLPPTGDAPSKYTSPLLSRKAAAVMGTDVPPPKRPSNASSGTSTDADLAVAPPKLDKSRKQGLNLKSGFVAVKKTFERENFLLSLLYGGGEGPKGEW